MMEQVLNISGGVLPYKYNWSNAYTVNSFTNVPSGNYSVQIKDSNACTTNLNNIILKDSSNNISIFLGKDTAFCPG